MVSNSSTTVAAAAYADALTLFRFLWLRVDTERLVAAEGTPI